MIYSYRRHDGFSLELSSRQYYTYRVRTSQIDILSVASRFVHTIFILWQLLRVLSSDYNTLKCNHGDERGSSPTRICVLLILKWCDLVTLLDSRARNIIHPLCAPRASAPCS